MEHVSKTSKLYSYSELSDAAKENAKKAYLENEPRRKDFERLMNEDLDEYFPVSSMTLQYRLDHLREDGVNIYGCLNLKDLIELVDDKDGCYKGLEAFSGFFNDSERDTLCRYADICGSYINVVKNEKGVYCISREISFAEDWLCILKDNAELCESLNETLVRRLEWICIKVLEALSKMFEAFGYKFLYSVDENEMELESDIGGWKFFEDGTLCKEQ